MIKVVVLVLLIMINIICYPALGCVLRGTSGDAQGLGHLGP